MRCVIDWIVSYLIFMLNDRYCEYYPTYKGVITADADQCYRVCTMWRLSLKPDAYAKKYPQKYRAPLAYPQVSLGRMKSILQHQRTRKYVKGQTKLRIAYFRREASKLTLRLFSLTSSIRPQ